MRHVMMGMDGYARPITSVSMTTFNDSNSETYLAPQSDDKMSLNLSHAYWVYSDQAHRVTTNSDPENPSSVTPLIWMAPR